MKKDKSYTLYVMQEQETKSIARFTNVWDARAVAYACHMHRTIEKGLKERWFIIDDSTGTEISY